MLRKWTKSRVARLVWVSASLLSTCLWATQPASAEPRWMLDTEVGAVWQSRNDIQIPNNSSATRFSLVDVTGNGPTPTVRVEVDWQVAPRHHLRAILAPLTVTETAVLKSPVNFAGVAYAAGRPTKATYRFNSWRFGYRYGIHQGETWNFTLGFTAKVRDAKVELRQEGVASRDTDVGFVPLLHVASAYEIRPRWRLELSADGLAGGPGRAVDATLRLAYHAGERAFIGVGYRTLEGGADVDSVYNFAWLHSAVGSVAVRF